MWRLVVGRPRLFASVAIGLLSFPLLPSGLTGQTRAILAWDLGSLVFLGLHVTLFSSERKERMAADSERQQEGEWTVFGVTLAGVLFSLGAVLAELSGTKDLPGSTRGWHVALVATTLLLSWLVIHTLFALRYAHEYYELDPCSGLIRGGLAFPAEDSPDYWDFCYFSFVLGMTFQVSDVQVVSRKFRHLALVHGVVSFAFNTLLIAVSVNIASGMM